jgi:hypothetical protein
MSNVIKFPRAQQQKAQPEQLSFEEVMLSLDALNEEALANIQARYLREIQKYRDLGYSEFQARLHVKKYYAQIADSRMREQQAAAAEKQKNVALNKQKQKQSKTNNKAKRKAWKALQQA